MPSELTNKDYVSILKFYNLRIPKSKRLLSIQAEKIMAEKEKNAKEYEILRLEERLQKLKEEK